MDLFSSLTLIDEVAFTLRVMASLIGFALAFEAWQLYKHRRFIRTSELAKTLCLVFVVFGIGRIFSLVIDQYLLGIASNVVNNVTLLYLCMYLRISNNQALEDENELETLSYLNLTLQEMKLMSKQLPK